MKHFVPIVLACLVLASCGKSAEGKQPSSTSGGSASGPQSSGGSVANPPAAQGGASSPQEAFDMAKAATLAKDWGRFWDIVTPDEQDMLVFSAMNMGGFAALMEDDEAKSKAKSKEFEAMTKKYGIPESKDGPDVDMNDREELADLFKGVKDKRGFFVEAFAWVEKNSKPGEGAKMHMGGTLKDIEETGDTATATMVDEDQKEKPCAFRKIGGRWYMSQPSE